MGSVKGRPSFLSSHLTAGHGGGHVDKPLSPLVSHTKINSSPHLGLLVYSSQGYKPGLLRGEAALYVTRCPLKQGGGYKLLSAKSQACMGS